MKTKLLIASLCVLIANTSWGQPKLKEIAAAALKKNIEQSLTQDINAMTDAQVDAWRVTLVDKIERYYPSNPPSKRIFLTQMWQKLANREELMRKRAAAARGGVAGGPGVGAPGVGGPGAGAGAPGALVLFTPGGVAGATGPILKSFQQNPQQAFQQFAQWLLQQRNILHAWAANKQLQQDLKNRIARGEFDQAYAQYAQLFNDLLAYKAADILVKAYVANAALAMVYTFASILDILNAIGITIANQDALLQLWADTAAYKIIQLASENNTLGKLTQTLQDNPDAPLANTSAILPVSGNLQQFDTPSAPIINMQIIKRSFTMTDEQLKRYEELIKEISAIVSGTFFETLTPETYKKEMQEALQKRIELEQLKGKAFGLTLPGMENIPSYQELESILQKKYQELTEQMARINEFLALLSEVPKIYTDKATQTLDLQATKNALDEVLNKLENLAKILEDKLPTGFMDYFRKEAEAKAESFDKFYAKIQEKINKEQQQKLIEEEQKRAAEKLSETQKAIRIANLLAQSMLTSFIDTLKTKEDIAREKNKIETLIKDLKNENLKKDYLQKLKALVEEWNNQIVLRKLQEAEKEELKKLSTTLTLPIPTNLEETRGTVKERAKKLEQILKFKKAQEAQKAEQREPVVPIGKPEEGPAGQLNNIITAIDNKIAEDQKQLDELEADAQRKRDEEEQRLKKELEQSAEAKGKSEERKQQALALLEEIAKDAKDKIKALLSNVDKSVGNIQRDIDNKEPLETIKNNFDNLSNVVKEKIKEIPEGKFKNNAINLVRLILRDLSDDINLYKNKIPIEETIKTIEDLMAQYPKEKFKQEITSQINKNLNVLKAKIDQFPSVFDTVKAFYLEQKDNLDARMKQLAEPTETPEQAQKRAQQEFNRFIESIETKFKAIDKSKLFAEATYKQFVDLVGYINIAGRTFTTPEQQNIILDKKKIIIKFLAKTFGEWYQEQISIYKPVAEAEALGLNLTSLEKQTQNTVDQFNILFSYLVELRFLRDATPAFENISQTYIPLFKEYFDSSPSFKNVIVTLEGKFKTALDAGFTADINRSLKEIYNNLVIIDQLIDFGLERIQKRSE